MNTEKKEEREYVYTKFDKEELDIFCNILDVEKAGIINLADLEAAAKNLGLESIYQDIRNLLKSKIDMQKGGIPVGVLKEYLLSNVKTFDEEMEEIFEYFDYDKKGTLSKHKLKIIASELSKLNSAHFGWRCSLANFSWGYKSFAGGVSHV